MSTATTTDWLYVGAPVQVRTELFTGHTFTTTSFVTEITGNLVVIDGGQSFRDLTSRTGDPQIGPLKTLIPLPGHPASLAMQAAENAFSRLLADPTNAHWRVVLNDLLDRLAQAEED